MGASQRLLGAFVAAPLAGAVAFVALYATLVPGDLSLEIIFPTLAATYLTMGIFGLPALLWLGRDVRSAYRWALIGGVVAIMPMTLFTLWVFWIGEAWNAHPNDLADIATVFWVIQWRVFLSGALGGFLFCKIAWARSPKT
jgi:hypothetical protein